MDPASKLSNQHASFLSSHSPDFQLTGQI